MAGKLSNYKVLTFDCYGTLIDWESGIWDAFQPLLMRNECDFVTRDVLLRSFSELEHAQQTATPGLLYPELLARVHNQLAAQFSLKSDSALDQAFGASVASWPAFPDSADALRRLAKYYKLAVLSNVNRAGFAASNRKLGVTFDAVYTAEDIGSYKPNPENFQYLITAIERDLHLNAGDILHTAQSLFHDHWRATEFGLASCWIDRQRLSEGGSWGATRELAERPKTDFTFFTLADMANALDAEQAG